MKKNKKIYLRILFSILLISNFILIFIFSSQNGDDSSSLSKGFIYGILRNFLNDSNQIEGIIQSIEPLVRKLAHFSIYALSGVWAIGLLETFSIKDEHKIAIGTLIGFLYAVSDEFHQSFVSERSESPIDILIDTFGFLFGILLIILILKLIEKMKEKNKRKSQK